ncbi:MAG TPA: exo 1,3/1,4-beta-D-glucan glucohydrolase [Rhizomicrobium sp.]|nr:exo 1,3/1,4-beta-D-glucan glucohydrolase [Rhizomicrobium sp.]
MRPGTMRRRDLTRFSVIAFAGLALTACAAATSQAPTQTYAIHPDAWPKLDSAVLTDPAIDARVADILSKMTVEEKVGQIMQADVASVTPADVKQYHLGSILDGGNSGPNNNDRAPAADWLKAADAFYAASMDVAPGHVAIPIMWGSDSVHGNSNIIGATIFPHNIGLGAMRDPALVREIGKITAIETKIVGQDWTFAPTLAVVRDDRWGRTYESYSEDPSIVREYAGEMVQGIQGTPGAPDFLRDGHIIATAKHFLGDGGTDKGKDQGDDLIGEDELMDIHSAGYQAAIAAGVQAVMVSYSSWHGQKMSGNRALLNDVLIDRFGFNGFVVSDWNAHGQLPGCTVSDCPAALLAGIDMYMAPDSWKGLYKNTLAEVQSGAIAMARLDEAVSRILRVKLRAGLFEAGPPSKRPYGGDWSELGSPAHRAVARQAVRESLVLLKNEHQILPLRPQMHVLVAGDGADNMSKQTGGWTISWQGTGNTRADFPHAQTIYDGIAQQVKAAGGTATLSADGSFRKKPDVAIVVFGEDPYAEFMGDRDNLAFEPGDPHDLRLIRALKAQGIPVVSVFLSGRPLYVTREINASDAFVAAWLPGSEGGGVADMLFRKKDGSIQYDFRGRLSFSWPRSPDQTPLNVPRPGASAAEWQAYNPLFPFDYGLDYAHPRDIGPLPEAPGADLVAANVDIYLREGHAAPPWSMMVLAADNSGTPVPRLPASTPALSLSSADHLKQEDTLVAKWTAKATLAIVGKPVDLSRQANGDMALSIDLKVDRPPAVPVILTQACGDTCRASLDMTQAMRDAAGKGWTGVAVPLKCFKQAGLNMNSVMAPFALTSDGAFEVNLTAVKLTQAQGTLNCPATPQS